MNFKNNLPNKCYVIAEAGLNHNGSVNIAKQLIDLAVEAGADAVKFQKRTVDKLAVKTVLDASDDRFPEFGKTYREIREYLEFDMAQYKKIKQYTEDRGLDFLCTAFDPDAADFLEELGVEIYKLASHSATNIELLEYCSSQNADVGLRSDLRRLRNLSDKNNQATERILAMMEAEFTDRSADVRGYSWLGNVLKFNEMKAMEWNDIIEGKENFRYSEEGLEVLEDVAYSDWRELCDTNEMFEFDKHVDLNHRSPFADLVMDRPGSESPDAFAERYQAEWDVESWEHEYDQNNGQGEEILHEGVQHEAYEVDEYPEEISDQQQEAYEVVEYPEENSDQQQEAFEVDEYPEEISEYHEADLGDYGN